MKIDETNYDILQKASNKIGLDLEIKWYDAENIDGYIEEDTLLSLIQELTWAIGDLQDEIEELKRPNDYDPELEIPVIHGKGISW